MDDEEARSGPKNRGRHGLSRRGALTGMATLTAAGGAAAASQAGGPGTQFRGRIAPTLAQSTPDRREPAKPPAGSPNVVVILLDDVGYSDLGCYGGEIQTPAMDGLASGGLRYLNFRTTGVCSATRASLLTGLNPHSAGIGWLTALDAGFPGYRGDLAQDAVTLSEALSQSGYATYQCGKWHVNHVQTENAAGPMVNWPLQRGFDRAYWFQGHSTDYFRPPNLMDGNEHVSVERADYYVTDDLTDRAISYLRDHQAQAPDRPFFLYLAHAGAHSPLHARREDMARVRGRYDAGWDAVRAQRLARQKSMGLIPAGTQLPARNPGVQAWEALTGDQRLLYARYMEAYAAVVERLDWNIERVVSALRQLGVLDNTLIILTSDNGGSPDGGPSGTPNLMAGLNGGVTIAQAVEQLDAIGGPDTYPMYPMGWAMASNTPFRLHKHDTHLGGVADPLVVHWPRGVSGRGELRRQYAHVMDLCATILDCAGCAPPTERRGERARPMQAVSFRRSLSAADALETRLEQHFEMNGLRAMYARGWRLVSTGRFMEANDRWELFDLNAECNEVTDLAAKRPDMVRALEAKWMRAAQKYDVFPVDSRDLRQKSFADFFDGGGRAEWDLTPPLDEIPSYAAPAFFGRSHDIEIELDPLRARDEGVLIAYGAQTLGFVIYVKQGRLHYEAVARPAALQFAAPIAIGARRIGFRQTMTERPWRGGGELLVDGQVAASLAYGRALFGTPMQGLQIGRNTAGPVSHAYPQPFNFTGAIRRVRIRLDTTPYADAELRRFDAMFKPR